MQANILLNRLWLLWQRSTVEALTRSISEQLIVCGSKYELFLPKVFGFCTKYLCALFKVRCTTTTNKLKYFITFIIFLQQEFHIWPHRSNSTESVKQRSRIYPEPKLKVLFSNNLPVNFTKPLMSCLSSDLSPAHTDTDRCSFSLETQSGWLCLDNRLPSLPHFSPYLHKHALYLLFASLRAFSISHLFRQTPINTIKCFPYQHQSPAVSLNKQAKKTLAWKHNGKLGLKYSKLRTGTVKRKVPLICSV